MMPALSSRCRREATVARATLANRDSSSAPARGLSRISRIRSTSRASSGVGTSDTAAAYYDSTVDYGDFPVQNLPYGVFSTVDGPRRVGVAIGDRILDLSRTDVPYREDFAQPTLNTFMARGRPAWDEVREYLTENAEGSARVEMKEATLHLPFEVADYVDFYSSEHHATNGGRILRPDTEPLSANWKHLPVGYHGRAGTVVVDGTPIVRPRGQTRSKGEPPAYGPTARLDIEAEVGFVVGVPSRMGEPVPIDDFDQHVFGVVLVNDWSARDIQAWESQPL